MKFSTKLCPIDEKNILFQDSFLFINYDIEQQIEIEMNFIDNRKRKSNLISNLYMGQVLIHYTIYMILKSIEYLLLQIIYIYTFRILLSICIQ